MKGKIFTGESDSKLLILRLLLECEKKILHKSGCMVSALTFMDLGLNLYMCF